MCNTRHDEICNTNKNTLQDERVVIIVVLGDDRIVSLVVSHSVALTQHYAVISSILKIPPVITVPGRYR